jgi:hypothetical protein
MNDSIALFEQIRVLAQVDWRQANTLAADSGVIVKTREGTIGVLTGVTSAGKPQIEIDQRSIVWTHLQFANVEATGHVWEVSA